MDQLKQAFQTAMIARGYHPRVRTELLTLYQVGGRRMDAPLAVVAVMRRENEQKDAEVRSA